MKYIKKSKIIIKKFFLVILKPPMN